MIVTLPEEMPTNETIELIAGVEGELGLHVQQVVVNGMLPPLFSQQERDALLTRGKTEETTPGQMALGAGARRAVRERVQAESLARLTKETKPPKIYLPYLFDGAETRAALSEIIKRF